MYEGWGGAMPGMSEELQRGSPPSEERVGRMRSHHGGPARGNELLWLLCSSGGSLGSTALPTPAALPSLTLTICLVFLLFSHSAVGPTEELGTDSVP